MYICNEVYDNKSKEDQMDGFLDFMRAKGHFKNGQGGQEKFKESLREDGIFRLMDLLKAFEWATPEDNSVKKYLKNGLKRFKFHSFRNHLYKHVVFGSLIKLIVVKWEKQEYNQNCFLEMLLQILNDEDRIGLFRRNGVEFSKNEADEWKLELTFHHLINNDAGAWIRGFL